MKNNRGITLTSLIIYIAMVIVVAAVVIRITTYFSNNMKDVADVEFETEFEKINLYLLTEAKTIGNAIVSSQENENTISFTKGNKYTYDSEKETIYLNDSIKICNNVQTCTFEQKIADNGKTMIVLTIKINDVEKSVSYVLIDKNEKNSINEIDYTFEVVTKELDTGNEPQ